MTAAWRVDATLLPDGAVGTWWVAGGRMAAREVAGAEPLPGRYLLPGLVDAHCHLTLQPGESGPVPAPAAAVDRTLGALRDAGVLAVRDTGAHDDTTLRLAGGGAGDLTVVACGRFLAPPGGYFPGVFTGVPAAELPQAGLEQVAGGATWVKLVADFPPGADFTAPSAPSYDIDVVRALVDAVHRAGGRVAAHVTLPIARELVEAGIDSVEHGTNLDEETLELMAARGTAWTPTLGAVLQPVPPGAPPSWAPRRVERVERMRRLLPVAARLGVPVLAGSDVVGTVAGEVALLAEHGLGPAAALAAATTAARGYLGLPSLTPGAPADLVTYDADPRADPEVLARPVAVVARGRRVR